MSHQTLHPAVRLKLLRENLQLSQRELAEEFNVTSGAIAHWEMGTNPIPGPVLKIIELFEDALSHGKSDQTSLRIFQDIKKGLISQGLKDEQFKEVEESIFSYINEINSLNKFHAKIKFSFIQRLLKSLKNSKGLTIKFLQLLSYLELGLPIEVRMALGNLQGKLKPLSFKRIQEIIEKEYGRPLEDIFSEFEKSPIAVTSLAQVHYARLKDGAEVAVKVQSPDMKKILEEQFSRIEKIGKIASYLGKEPTGILDELRRAIYQECDYLIEARNQEKIRNILLNQPRTIVPKVYLDLSRPHVLVSEFVHGENFHSFAIRASQDSKNIVAETVLKTLSHLSFCHNLVHGDIHAENFLVKNDKVIFLDFGRIYNFPEARMRLEIQFYQAILFEKKEEAKKLCGQIGFAKDEEQFDFDEFWSFLLNSQAHILKDGKFKFTKEYVARLAREGRRFNSRHKLKLSPESFWAFTFSSGSWALFAELDAETNWRQIAIETFNQASSRFLK